MATPRMPKSVPEGFALTADQAQRAAAAADKAGLAIDKVTAAMRKLQSAQRASAGSEAAREALGLQTKAGAAAEKAAEKQAKAAAKAADAQAKAQAKANADARRAGGETAQLVNKLGGLMSGSFSASGAVDKLTEALRGLGPEGQAVAVILETVIAVVTFAAQTLWDWASAAVAAAQRRDALVATFQALSNGAEGAGEAVLAATSKLAASLPYTTAQVNAWAKSLMAAGIQGEAMERGVRAIASATAIMGKEGGAAAEMLIKRFAMVAETGGKMKLDRRLMNALANAGVSAAALAQALGVPADKLATMQVDAVKLGDAFQKALTRKAAGALANVGLTWDSIKAKFDEGVASIFAGMSDAVRPLMQAIKDLFGEFNKGAPSVTLAGGVMKTMLTTLFSLAARAISALHYGFLFVEVAALKVAIAIAPFVNWLRRIYSNAEVLRGLKMIFVALVAPIAAIVAFLGLVAAGIAIIVTGIVTGVAMIAAGFSWIVGQVANFIAGIVDGIKSGTGAVVAAVTGLASSALAAFKSTLGIHSPSAVMRLQGQYMAAGTVQGLERGTPSVEAAAARMAGAGAAGGAQGGAGGRGGGGNTYQFDVTINGAGKPTAEMAEEFVTLVFERLAGTQGLAPA